MGGGGGGGEMEGLKIVNWDTLLPLLETLDQTLPVVY